MAYLDPNAKHKLSNLRRTMSSRGGKILSIGGVKKGVLKEMGVAAADTRRISEHIASTAHQLGRGLKSKKQILEHFRGKWGLSDTNAKKLLAAVAPENIGPSKEQVEKRKKVNIAEIRRQRLGGAGSLSRFAGDTVKNRAEEVRKKVLQPRVPGAKTDQSGELASVTSLVGHEKSSVTDGLQAEATGVVARSGELEVKDGGLQVKTHKGRGLAKDPDKAVASIHELEPEKKEKDKPADEPHEDVNHNIPLAA